MRKRVKQLEKSETARKQAEEALLESEERFKSVVEASLNAIIAVDDKGKIILFNQSAEELFQYSREEAINQPVKILLRSETASQHQDRVEKFLARGIGKCGHIGKRLERVFKRKDGTFFTAEVAMSGGRINGKRMIAISIYDLTDRKRVEEKLSVAYHALNSSVNGVIMTNLKGEITYVNPSFLRIFEYDNRDEVLGKSAAEIFVSKKVKKFSDVSAIIDATRDETEEFDTRRKDGSVLVTEVSSSNITNIEGGIVGRIASFVDITGRKEAELQLRKYHEHLEESVEERSAELKMTNEKLKQEIAIRIRVAEALRESEERLRSFMNSAPNALVHFDSELNYVDLNNALMEFFPNGTKKQDIIGKNILDIVPDIKETGRYDKYMEVIKTGKQFMAEDITPHPKFGNRYLEVRAFKVGTGLGMIITDITDRKQAEQALLEAQEKLIRREKLALLGQLSGGVGHELRNPLGVIANAVYYLKAVLTEADENTKEYLEIISSEVQNAEKIISDLLDISRIKSVDREEATAAELIKQALKKQLIPENIKVTTKIASGLPYIYVDPRQIHQVLTNIITNARQAMPEGGKMIISARMEKGRVLISISDTGCGISKENRKKLFEPLFTTKARGIGLGLTVSKSLVEASSGRIRVMSKEGKGSTFTIVLPTKGT